VLATIASAVSKSAHHALAPGFRVSYVVATGLVVLTAAFVTLLLSGPRCQLEAARLGMVPAPESRVPIGPRAREAGWPQHRAARRFLRHGKG
jgi:hypothetical protein